MKKVFLWIGATLLTPILLFVTLTVLLYLPPVQNWAVRQAAQIASEQTGFDVSVGRVRLVFPLDLGVYDVRVVKQNDSLPQVRDTVADMKRLVVDVRLRPLFGGKVVVDELELNDTRLNTSNLIAAARIRGRVGRLSVKSRGIDLGKQTADLNDALLSDTSLDIALSDTTEQDTTTSETLWKIYIYKVTVTATDVTLHTPGDTMTVRAGIGRATACNGEIDLGRSLYSVAAFDLNDGSVAYDNNMAIKQKGLDPNHICLSDINIGIDSIYYCDPEARLSLRRFEMKEKSGIEVTQLMGYVAMDAKTLQLPALRMCTPDSQIDATVAMDLNALDSINPGTVAVRLAASIGKQDVMRFAGGMPQQFVRRYPNHPISIRGSLNGNMQHVDITGLNVTLPTAFSMSAEGTADNPTDIDRMKASIKLKAKTQDINFVTALAGAGGAYRIPQGITLDAVLKANRQRYTADMTVREGRGTVKLDGNVDMKTMAYKAKADIRQVNLHHFMPKDSLYTVTASLSAEGRGTDFLSPRTSLMAKAGVDHFAYGSSVFDGIEANVAVKDGRGRFNLHSRNALIDGNVLVDALLSRKRIEATIATELNKADLQRMRMTEKPMQLGVCAHIDISSDMKQYHAVKGYMNDFTLRTEKKIFRPTDLELDVLTRKDTTWAKVSSGTMSLDMTASGGYESLIEQGMRLKDEIMAQTRNKVIDQPRLRELFPNLSFRLASGTGNPFANFLRFNGFEFDDMLVKLNTSPQDGLNGDIHFYSTVIDSMKIDTVRLRIYQDDTNIRFNGMVQNNRKNRQFVFKTLVDGTVLERGAELNLRYFDADDKLGVLVGTRAEMCDSGINVHLLPERPILGYKEFALNTDNYLFLGRDRRISAKVDLIADDGTGVKVYSDDSNRDMLQDITVSLNRFDLDKITSVMPYAPRITGVLHGDFHAMQDKDQRLTVVSDMTVRKMTYEKNPMGDIGSEFAYLMRDDSTHVVEATLTRDGEQVGLLSGTYLNKGDGWLDATFDMTRFPLSIANGFVPDQLFGLEGYAEGTVTVKGRTDSPIVDGEVLLDSSYLVSVPYGMRLRFDNDPVRIVGSNLLLENFSMYAHNNNPLTISGNIDFSNLDRINMAVRMRARDYQLIDAKQTRGSVAYGKAFVNFFGSMRGDLDNLQMRGQLDVLGKTDMTYILTDSPLNTDDQLKGLVTFTDFSDTTGVKAVERPAIGGLDMQLTMNIEEGAHVFCALNADRSNYVNLEGGGELRMTYSAANDMQLTGRYTINSGTMKYSLPLIPLKTFTIQEGSYIEFNGDMMNPRLNLAATEEMKVLVTQEGGASRNVTFNCGVKVTKTLNDMGLEFTIAAPEDMAMTNELATMSAEDRGKTAVMMLTTGMYMADSNTTGNFSMNSALSSFMQSQINNIAGSAMRTVDLSVGIDQNADASGNTYNDYSFKFAKRFWNNRVNFVIGGKVSGNTNDATTTEQDQAFIDNVSLEYRIDQTAMRYVRMFYNKEANDILEGQISEYGAGFMWRKKSDKFWKLFNFRTADSKTQMRRMPGRDAMPLSNGQNGGRRDTGSVKTQTALPPMKQESTKADENNK